ncbi:UDP-N-acetylmuramate dehydrogenase [Patescibacteria group bacterium]|nr:UDP-N-acetylmuramate dehydrogenase [Patescibacteria group bacterium]MBU4098423.1 UDP-N-acetylmuramate dehydrogenase [Patescibacteria group bacterium]
MIIQKDFPLSQILWYEIGGKAQYLLEVEKAEDVEEALDFVEKNKIQRVLVVGLGSNIIITDDYFQGAVIRIVQHQSCHSRERGRPHEVHSALVVNPLGTIKGEFITVFAGTTLDNLITFSLVNNLTGLEWAGGLPGTVGAGIRGNVGAFGKEIKDNLFSVDVIKRKNKGYIHKTLKKSDLHFSYRNSLVKENKNLIIISATFKLQPANPQTLALVEKIYKTNINYREKHHPLEYPTCGSVFKNISESDHVQKIISIWPDVKELVNTKWHGKVSMGYIIGRLGFSGYRIGNMQVSQKHNNFIVNLGAGKARDVITIIKKIQNKVHETFGFLPEVEVEIVK